MLVSYMISYIGNRADYYSILFQYLICGCQNNPIEQYVKFRGPMSGNLGPYNGKIKFSVIFC